MTDVQKVSEQFSYLIRKALTPEELYEVNLRNADDLGGGGCATHDFIDANMEMHQAFLDVLDVDVADEHNIDQPHLVAMWNKAWDLSKANEFQPTEIGKAILLLREAVLALIDTKSSVAYKIIDYTDSLPLSEVFEVLEQPAQVTFYNEDFGRQLRGYEKFSGELTFKVIPQSTSVNLYLYDGYSDLEIMDYPYENEDQLRFDVDLANKLFDYKITEA